jgi:multidrug efflux system membrane fusion protein
VTTINTVLSAIAAGCLATACADVQGTEVKPARPVKVQAATPAAGADSVRYSAAIEPFEQVALAFKASGYVDNVLRRAGVDGRLRTAQPGDLITRGTVLARVRESEYRERVNQGGAQIAEVEASMEKARLDLDRARTLFAAESLTKPELDAAQASYDATRAKLQGARAELELASTALRDSALVAPSSGVLLERKIEVGSLVASGSVGFVLGDISAVKARFGIADAMTPAVKLGDRLDLVVDGPSGGSFVGRITAIAPAADPESRVFDVEVTIPNIDSRLRPGMIGTVTVQAGAGQAQPTPQPSVPLTAIVRSKSGDGQYAAFTIERRGDTDIARLRDVELGDVIGNGIVLKKGLAIGEKVIISGASLLVDGEPVRVIQ